ncbi:MAG: arginase family protein [Bacteriovoracales bacterium]|nr:arginase family protein [Bacteriovoracales bacterium]
MIEKRFLCPPGNGVFTVNTAKKRKDHLHQTLYKQAGEGVWPLWEKSLTALPSRKGSVLLGISSDCGGGILRGANWGPLFMRNELYAMYPPKETKAFFDLGDIRVIPHLLLDDYLDPETLSKCRKALYGTKEKRLPVSPLSMTMELVEQFYRDFDDKGLVSLGGDHSVSFPLVRPFLRRRRAQGRQVAVIHFDAHTDLMPSRLGIDICFGSWAYHILEDLPSPSHLYQLGLRSSNYDGAYWKKELGVEQFWADEIKERGAESIADEITNDLKEKGVDELYVSFDIDFIDPIYAGATGTPEPNGPTPEDGMVILEKLEKQFPIGGADMVEVAPFVRHDGNNQTTEPNSTLNVATRFVGFFIEALNRFYGVTT